MKAMVKERRVCLGEHWPPTLRLEQHLDLGPRLIWELLCIHVVFRLLTPGEKPATGAFSTCLWSPWLCLVLADSDLASGAAPPDLACSTARTPPAPELLDPPLTQQTPGMIWPDSFSSPWEALKTPLVIQRDCTMV